MQRLAATSNSQHRLIMERQSGARNFWSQRHFWRPANPRSEDSVSVSASSTVSSVFNSGSTPASSITSNASAASEESRSSSFAAVRHRVSRIIEWAARGGGPWSISTQTQRQPRSRSNRRGRSRDERLGPVMCCIDFLRPNETGFGLTMKCQHLIGYTFTDHKHLYEALQPEPVNMRLAKIGDALQELLLCEVAYVGTTLTNCDIESILSCIHES